MPEKPRDADQGGRRPRSRGEGKDPFRGLIALHAAGSLTSEESRELERHIEHCSACASEFAAHRETFARIALAIGRAEAPPRPELRERVIRSIAAEPKGGGSRRDTPQTPGAPEPPPDPRSVQVWKDWKPSAPSGLVTVRATEGAWEETSVPGVSVKTLHVDAERRYITMLVRMEPGSSYPCHRHAGIEECFVLRGDLRVGDRVLEAGDYQCAPAESRHGVQSTENGCLLLISSSQDDDLI